MEKTLVLIRFSGIYLLHYDESVILCFVMGTPIKVYTNTLNVERRMFAKIYVEIDLTLLVDKKVSINGHWYTMQYEGIHIICSSCGCYRHHTHDCKKTPDILMQSTIPMVAQPIGSLENDDVHE